MGAAPQLENDEIGFESVGDSSPERQDSLLGEPRAVYLYIRDNPDGTSVATGNRAIFSAYRILAKHNSFKVPANLETTVP